MVPAARSDKQNILDPAIRTNAIISLIKVTNYLLDQQIRKLEMDFLAEGGRRERICF